MKKLLIALTILMLVIAGCAKEDTKENEKEVVKEEKKEETKEDESINELTYGYDMPEDNVITKITVDELVNKMEAGDKIFVLFGRVT